MADAELLVHLWNGTMASGRRCDIKAYRVDELTIEVRWYGSGYDNDSFSPHRMRTHDEREATKQIQRLVEEQQQYKWRQMPIPPTAPGTDPARTPESSASPTSSAPLSAPDGFPPGSPVRRDQPPRAHRSGRNRPEAQ